MDRERPDYRLSQNEQLRLLAAKSLAHELGHAVDLGELDDRDFKRDNKEDEIYSGQPDPTGTKEDETPESVLLNGSREKRWSLMASGKTGAIYSAPMNGSYYAISIEELLSIQEDSENDDT